jgi:hypothetical protein
MILALDLSFEGSGITFFENNKFHSGYTFSPSRKLSNNQKIIIIANEIDKVIDGHYEKLKDVVIEDTFLGVNPKSFKHLNRLCGAVTYVVMDRLKREPIFYEAVSARRILGINPQTTKFDSQVLMMKQYYKHIDVKQYEQMSLEVRKKYVAKKITLKEHNSELTKISNLIGRDTKVTNNETDSIILGLAYLQEREIK